MKKRWKSRGPGFYYILYGQDSDLRGILVVCLSLPSLMLVPPKTASGRWLPALCLLNTHGTEHAFQPQSPPVHLKTPDPHGTFNLSNPTGSIKPVLGLEQPALGWEVGGQQGYTNPAQISYLGKVCRDPKIRYSATGRVHSILASLDPRIGVPRSRSHMPQKSEMNTRYAILVSRNKSHRLEMHMLEENNVR